MSRKPKLAVEQGLSDLEQALGDRVAREQATRDVCQEAL
jgi:hypothetical protein